jgi:hypothetical protein
MTESSHLFTETDCNVYARDSYLVLHAAQDGPITVKLPAKEGQPTLAGPWIISDVLTGAVVSRGQKFTLPMNRGETRVLRYR